MIIINNGLFNIDIYIYIYYLYINNFPDHGKINYTEYENSMKN